MKIPKSIETHYPYLERHAHPHCCPVSILRVPPHRQPLTRSDTNHVHLMPFPNPHDSDSDAFVRPTSAKAHCPAVLPGISQLFHPPNAPLALMHSLVMPNIDDNSSGPVTTAHHFPLSPCLGAHPHCTYSPVHVVVVGVGFAWLNTMDIVEVTVGLAVGGVGGPPRVLVVVVSALLSTAAARGRGRVGLAAAKGVPARARRRTVRRCIVACGADKRRRPDFELVAASSSAHRLRGEVGGRWIHQVTQRKGRENDRWQSTRGAAPRGLIALQDIRLVYLAE
ncbi:hypothetical protein QBC39DRAFT_365038 [Podospora conica]|nr:hypothetical protein QBC39DRAFT_365038 [Schizothecium conicum]